MYSLVWHLCYSTNMTRSRVIDMTLMMKLTSSWHDITIAEIDRILWQYLAYDYATDKTSYVTGANVAASSNTIWLLFGFVNGGRSRWL